MLPENTFKKNSALLPEKPLRNDKMFLKIV